MRASVYSLNHWYRHFIGVLDADGNRPVVTSMVGSCFANKGHKDYQQNIILQNLVLAGASPGVDFDGATGDPYFHKGGLSWLDNVRIDTRNRSVLFNTGPNPGGGSFWCTRCEIINHIVTMIAITEIDSAWFSDSVLISPVWNQYTARIGARSVNMQNVTDGSGNPVACGAANIQCRPGPTPELLRAPTLEWFESLVYAQPR